VYYSDVLSHRKNVIYKEWDLMKWLIAICILGFTATGHCESWKLFYSMTGYYDKDSISTSGDVKHLWVKLTEMDASYRKNMVELDCNLKTTCTTASYFYDSFDRLMKTSIPIDYAKRHIPIMFHKVIFDRTIEEFLFYAICEGRVESGY
jgi:hypothetical protein